MKRQQKRKHIENEDSEESDEKGATKSPDDASQPRSTGVARIQSPGTGGLSSASEYFSCVSSPSKLSKLIRGSKSAGSLAFSGTSMSPALAPQPVCSGVAEVQTLGAGEVSSASEDFCFSSPPKLIHGSKGAGALGIHGVQGDRPEDKPPLVQVEERGETLSASKLVSFSSRSSYKSCINSVCINKEETSMKIYYIEVKMKNGVAVSWEAEGTSESLEKQPRMEEVTLPEGLRVGTPPSDVSTRNLLSDSEPSGEEDEHKTKAESDDRPGSPAVEIPSTGISRVKTPDWLGSTESGFKCMACCRVFATIDILQEHVQCGIREGFSCHVFHRTLTQMRGNVESESSQEEEQEEKQQAEQEQKQDKREHEEEQPTGENLALKKPWSQCSGCVFHSPKEGPTEIQGPEDPRR